MSECRKVEQNWKVAKLLKATLDDDCHSPATCSHGAYVMRGLDHMDCLICRYFDLYSEYRPSRSKSLAPGDNDDVALWRQILVYAGCLIGVLVGPYVSAALTGNEPSLGEVLKTGNHIFWSAIIALALFPVIYKVVFDPKKPLIAQIALGLAAGFVAQKIVPHVIDLAPKLLGITS
jgi:hypothetical protein